MKHETLMLHVSKAEGEDVWCTCIACGTPTDGRGTVHEDHVGLPVEFLVRLRRGSETVWHGLHARCWDRNDVREDQRPRAGGPMVHCEGCGFHVEREEVVDFGDSLAADEGGPCVTCIHCQREPRLKESYRRGWNAGLDAAKRALIRAVEDSNLRRRTVTPDPDEG